MSYLVIAGTVLGSILLLAVILILILFNYSQRIKSLSKCVDNINEARIKQDEEICRIDGGHEWQFIKFNDCTYRCQGYFSFTYIPDIKYQYKCILCGKIKNYSWDELSKKEQQAMNELGLSDADNE